MSNVSIAPLAYSLADACPVTWPQVAEAQLHHAYPFLNQDNEEIFVIRRYLETLWLPESFNPLAYLVTSLQRIGSAEDSYASKPHPLHSLIRPILLSTRATSDKYRTELVQILENGGGAEEQEETMMWYAWEHEKTVNDANGQVDEEKWLKGWLERLERRETMIQILLHMLKMSLPGATPTEDSKPKKRKKKSEHDLPPETDEQRLESYMDKMVVWQLTSTLDAALVSPQNVNSIRGKTKAECHWTQVFYEDVVEPLFRSELPGQCDLFRSKLFPESPFSDAEETYTENTLNGTTSRAGSRAPSVPRGPITRVPSVSTSASTELQRSRSRSLRVLLARDEASQRASFVPPKRMLSREVNMSRVFKGKRKVQSRSKVPQEDRKAEAEKPKARRNLGTTLVEETPVKRRRAEPTGFDSQFGWQDQMHFKLPTPPPTSSNLSDVCIEDTPVATRKRGSREELEDGLSPLTPLQAESRKHASEIRDDSRKTGNKNSKETDASLFDRARKSIKDTENAQADEHADQRFMHPFKPANVTLLTEDDGDDVVMISPSPATRNQKAKLLSGRFKASQIADVEMATPTKRRTREK